MDWRLLLQMAIVFLRLLGFFLFVPVFSDRAIPGMVKILLAVALTFALYPVVRPMLGAVPSDLSGLTAMVLRETAIGFAMGFVAYLTFEGIQLAAQFLGYQMGFGFVGLVDPVNQTQTSVLVPLHRWVAIVVFLIADFHHDLFTLFVRSFEVSTTLTTSFIDNKNLMAFLMAQVGHLFAIAVQMAAPLALVILATQVTVGVLARLMPQMNIILFSFPISILLGIAGMYIVAPEMINYLNNLLGQMSGNVMELLRIL